jgi:lipopolysaccharide transport protein LptA
MKTSCLPALALALALALLPVAFAQEESPTPVPAMDQMESDSKKGPGFFSPMGDRPKGARTEITATKEATFDNEKNIAEFEGGVVVRDPQFTLTCDRLTVRLDKDRKGIETAEARGNVVVVQETANSKTPGDKAVGRAGLMIYKPATGEVTLREWPSIQQGINQQVATESSTVMFLRASGESKTVGGSKTVITDTTKLQ